MFKKKKPISPPGRYRPTTLRSEERNAAVFSYHASRSARPASIPRGQQAPVTAASKERRSMQRKWFKRAPVIVGFMVALVFAGLNIPVSDNPKVVAAQDARGGIFLRPSATYSAAVHALLSDSWSSNKITINTSQLEHDLQVQFPELARVTVSVPFIGTQPTVYLEPTMPTLIITTASTDVYVIDDTGRALIRASQVPGLSKLGLPVVKDESALPVTLGHGVLPSGNVAFITEVVGQLKAKQLEVESLTLPASTSELDVKVKGTPYTVKFNLMGNARAEVGAYLAVKQKLERERKTPGAYVDVRVEERAYYR